MKKQYALMLAAGLATSGVAYAGDCPGDCNGDGMATVLDFVCFQQEWVNQTDFGDCNGDTQYSVLDFVCFQEDWQDFAQGGCDGGDPVDDNFDDFDLGNACGQGNWEGWFQNPDVCGEITDAQAFSGSQSMVIFGSGDNGDALGDDMVQIVEGVEGGQWTFSTQTLVPDDAAGNAYIILLNTYNHDNVGLNWSLQVRLDADLGIVEAEFDGQFAGLITGEWTEFRAEIDLDADSVDYFYGGDQFVFGKSWVDGISGGGEPRIQGIDLYANEPPLGTTSTYFDDLSISEGIN